ncbi:hypothetical protein [Terrilactibacillus laevilacticus]|uniref:Nudix hydrolase domain-containing protein n=1 Tax=Terrilactibacillus laevilacticus TaxID=1380157 RepID=A0ABW5PQB1_9BACI|nr:hypothetical protein [Terrilactibacillus laevilacticus]
MGKMDEQIIVVKRSQLFGDDKSPESYAFQGTMMDESHISQLEHRIESHYDVMRRGDAEDNPTYKQPIPYAVIRRGDKLFAYKRLGGGGEERLHGKISLGVGGHMNALAGKSTFHELLSENLNRELHEELQFSKKCEMDIQTVGFINDDSEPVSQVHIGILLTINLPLDVEVRVKETEALEGKWMTLEELYSKNVYSRLEGWSSHALRAIGKTNN